MAYTQFTGGERYTSWNSLKENPEFKKGSTIEGIYKDKREVRTQNGMSFIYGVKTKTGMQGVWGTKILDDFFGAMLPGTQIKLTYLGKMAPKKGGREYHAYQCEYDKDTVPQAAPDEKLMAEAAEETFGEEPKE